MKERMREGMGWEEALCRIGPPLLWPGRTKGESSFRPPLMAMGFREEGEGGRGAGGGSAEGGFSQEGHLT